MEANPRPTMPILYIVAVLALLLLGCTLCPWLGEIKLPGLPGLFVTPAITPVTPAGRVYAGPDISRDGVELARFSVEGPEPAKVGNTLTLRFALRNTTAKEMVFKPYGILVGCRDPQGANRDFGHREVSLKPGASYDFIASIQVDKAGPWHFWPGYYLEHWGPYKWHEIVIQVE
jgi:hypothetical protein